MAHPASRPRALRRLAAALAMAFALGTSAACGAGIHSRPAAAPTTPPPPPPPPVYWPLTGLESGPVPDHPALAVKIENSDAARPQTGLDAADVVWEEVVEGGITRFVAVYHSSMPPEVGPVRSVRPMDAAIVAPLRGLLAFSGGQAPFVEAVTEAGLQALSHDAGSAGFRRIDTRRAPHNVYAGPAEFLAQADEIHRSAPDPQFRFALPGQLPTAVAEGAPTAQLLLEMSGVSRPSWTWSQPDGAWLRAEGSTPAVADDGRRLRAANVVVLRVQVVDTDYTDPAGNPVPETEMVGSGEALVATAGRTVAATWAKQSVLAPLELRGPNGWPLELAPGNTWVELVPIGSGSVTAATS